VQVIDRIHIREAASGLNISGEIIMPSDSREILQTTLTADSQWTSQRQEIMDNDVVPKLNLYPTKPEQISHIVSHIGEDHHWNWSNKALALSSSDQYSWFFLQQNEEIEGILIAYHPKDSELEAGNIFYIDYIASAPMNRDTPSRKSRYKGIGSTLIESACKFFSLKFGYKLGFSLHALPKAEPFYIRIGMQKLGVDTDKEGLTKFEMMESNCSAFLQKRKAS